MTENVLDVMTAQQHLCVECDEPHDFIYIDPRCHPQAGIQARYNCRDHLLRVECAECGRTVAEVSVSGAAPAGGKEAA